MQGAAGAGRGRRGVVCLETSVRAGLLRLRNASRDCWERAGSEGACESRPPRQVLLRSKLQIRTNLYLAQHRCGGWEINPPGGAVSETVMALSWPDRGLAGAPRCLRAVGIFLVIFVGSGGRGSSTDRYELASGLGHEAAIRAYIHWGLPRKGKKMVRTAVVTWRNTISPERRPEPPPDKRSFRPTYPKFILSPALLFSALAPRSPTSPHDLDNARHGPARPSPPRLTVDLRSAHASASSLGYLRHRHSPSQSRSAACLLRIPRSPLPHVPLSNACSRLTSIRSRCRRRHARQTFRTAKSRCSQHNYPPISPPTITPSCDSIALLPTLYPPPASPTRTPLSSSD